MSNVEKFNENLFNDWSIMDLSDYEKEYLKKFKRTSKNIKKYYERYVKLYDSDTESSSESESDNEQENKVVSKETKVVPKSTNKLESKVCMNIVKEETNSEVAPPNPDNVMINSNTSNISTNTALSSYFMEFNGFNIRQRSSDGYIHATDMCKVGKKLFADYNRLKETKKFIEALNSNMCIPISQLITSIKGNSKSGAGTWIHPRIAINLAQWISPQFAVKVSEWTQKFIEGDISLIADIKKQHDKVHNVTSSISFVEISNDINLSKEETQAALIKMHETNISILNNQLREKEGIITEKDGKIGELKRIIEEMRQESKNALSEIKDIAIDSQLEARAHKKISQEQSQIATKTLGKLNVVENKLNVVENKLDKAVGSVVEKGKGKEYNSYIRVYKLQEPKHKDGINYNYVVTRTKEIAKRDRSGRYDLNSKYEKILFELKPNYSNNAWNIARNKLEKEKKIYVKGTYFFIYENNGVPVISEEELEETVRNVLIQNKNRIKQ